MWSAGSTSLECSLIYHLPFSQSLPSSRHEGSISILLISQRINWFLPWCQYNWRSQALTHCSPFLYSKGCQELLWSYVMLPWERRSTSKLSFSNASKLVWFLLQWSAGFLIWSHGVLQSHGPQTLWHQRPWKTVFPQTGALRRMALHLLCSLFLLLSLKHNLRSSGIRSQGGWRPLAQRDCHLWVSSLINPLHMYP